MASVCRPGARPLRTTSSEPSAATPSEVSVAPWTSRGLYQRTTSGDGLRMATVRPSNVLEGEATSNAQFSAPGVRISPARARPPRPRPSAVGGRAEG